MSINHNDFGDDETVLSAIVLNDNANGYVQFFILNTIFVELRLYRTELKLGCAVCTRSFTEVVLIILMKWAAFFD